MSRLARYRPGAHQGFPYMHVLCITFASLFIFVIRCACVFLTLSQLTINLYWLENHLGRTTEATDSGGSQLYS